MAEEDDSKPTPDPTVLTTEQLLREVDRVKELMTALVEGLQQVTDERFRSMQRDLSAAERLRIEQKADAAAARLEQKKDTKDAVDAALIAQKEAVKEQTLASEKQAAKAEASNIKQTDQLQALFTSAIAQVTTTFNDLKTRVERIENLKAGRQESSAGIYAALGLAVIILGLIVAASNAIFR